MATATKDIVIENSRHCGQVLICQNVLLQTEEINQNLCQEFSIYFHYFYTKSKNIHDSSDDRTSIAPTMTSNSECEMLFFKLFIFL